MKKKRVLMVSCGGLGLGGVQTVIMEIVRAMHQDCVFDILLFTDEKRHYDDEFMSYGGQIFRIPFYSGKSNLRKKADYLIRGWGIYRGVLKILRENPPYDVIHCNNHFESALCLKAAVKSGVPVRISHAHIETELSRSRMKNCLNAWYRRSIAQNATDCIGCAEQVCKEFYAKKTAWKVINNPYSEKKFHLREKRLHSSAEISLTQVGSFCENKNQLFSLHVLKKILEQGKKAHLNLVGHGGYLKVIEEEIAELNLGAHVTVHPGNADIPAIFEKTSALLLPSMREGFGIVLIEAQSMCVPCYASDTVPQTTNCGGVIYLSLASGASAWAERILADHDEATFHGRTYDCTAFSTHEVVKEYKKLYGGQGK